MDQDPAFWNAVEELFAQSMELHPSERAAFLDRRCDGRPALRSEIESLLAAHHDADRFLSDSLVHAAAPRPVDRFVGTTLGRYRLLDRIGEGGMGVVYRAARADGDFDQHLAVKVFDLPVKSADTLRQFRIERQILANLHHPHIVALIDGGIADQGPAFLAMEYVEGAPITHHCNLRRASLEERLRLVQAVCGAMQYAHRHGIVHRDLKPANILVTVDGVPKVLDFGIAKLLDHERVADVTVTVAPRPLTPNYASPEQLRGLPITTASDIYSLGLVLYELIAGVRPYELADKTLEQMIAVVAEEDTPRPSERAIADGARPGCDPPRLRGDLDAIVFKALSKTPNERYASAQEFADDIGRHLAGQPVLAREPSSVYVLMRFARRHRAPVGAAIVSLVALVIALGVSLRQMRIARAERDRAEARFADVRRLANSVIYEFHDAIANLPGATPARRLLVGRAIEYLDSLASEARTDVTLQRELADAYQKIGQVQNAGLGANLGDTTAAVASYRKALNIRQTLVARTPANPKDVLGLALVEFDLGALQRVEGEVAQAEQSFLSAASRVETLLRAGTLADADRVRVAAIYQRLSEIQTFRGETVAALQSAEKALAEGEAALRAQPSDRLTRSIVAAASYQLAEALAHQKRFEQALMLTRRARALLEESLRENPLEAQETRILLYALNGESRYLQELADVRSAVVVCERALEVAEQAFKRDPEDRWSRMSVAVAADALGSVLLDVGDAPNSERRFRRSLTLAKEALDEDPQSSYARLQLASAEWGLGRALISIQDPSRRSEACGLLRRVRQYWVGLQSKGELPPGETSELPRLLQVLDACRPS